jgi:hypothetical protein
VTAPWLARLGRGVHTSLDGSAVPSAHPLLPEGPHARAAYFDGPGISSPNADVQHYPEAMLGKRAVGAAPP